MSNNKMKWLRWLLGENVEVENKVVDEPCITESELAAANSELAAKKGFVDEETGKVYKTAGALKGAQTRRRNKKAKAKK